MSTRLSSYHPAVQAVYDAIASHDNARLPALLDAWRANDPHPDHEGFFFQACCNKQGAGLVRILVAKGLKCDQATFDLAISRQAWSVARAMLPAMTRLPSPVEMMGGPSAPGNLLDALAGGQLDLARAMLPLYQDPEYVANAALHHLARGPRKHTQRAVSSIAWLVEEGANPNQHLLRNTHPLEASLSGANAEMSLALVQSGAVFAFPHAMNKIIHCTVACRDDDAKQADRPTISAVGWSLLEAGLAAGLKLPDVLQTGWGAYYFAGTEKLSVLHPDDVPKIHALAQSAALARDTPQPACVQRAPRL